MSDRRGDRGPGEESVENPKGESDERNRNLADVPEQGETIEETRVSARAWIGRFLGPLLAILAYFTLPTGDGGLAPEGVAVVSVGILMAVWWVSEAIPIPATALLPIVLFPLFGVADIGGATAPYADDVVFLFMGGFMLALSMQRWGLHRRIALLTILAVGTNTVRIIGGFMIATAFLSMWVSNTATTVMMLPIGLSVLGLVLGTRDTTATTPGPEDEDEIAEEHTGEGASNFAVCLMLAIAYAASIGGLATLIGSPPTVFMVGFMSETYDVEIGFANWMLVGVPLSAVFLVITWVVLTRIIYPPEMSEISGSQDLIRNQLSEMGSISRGERIVLVIFILTALAWVTREPLSGLPGLGELSDAGIAITAAVALFSIPVDWRNGIFTLDWSTALKLPWGVLLLFGGGLSLASAVTENEVDQWIGSLVAGFTVLPVILLVMASAVVILLLTELTSNTATGATFLPILAGVAIGVGLDPLLLIVPATFAASCAFMLPVATPPNAIVFGSGYVTIVQMVRGGIWLNIIAILLITAAVYTLAGFALGVEF